MRGSIPVSIEPYCVDAPNDQNKEEEIINELNKAGSEFDTVIIPSKEGNGSEVYQRNKVGKVHKILTIPQPPKEVYQRIHSEISRNSMAHLVPYICKQNQDGWTFLNGNEIDLATLLRDDGDSNLHN